MEICILSNFFVYMKTVSKNSVRHEISPEFSRLQYIW